MTSQKTNTISTCLWLDDQAEEAANFYVSTFEKAAILNRTPFLVDTPSDKPVGSTMTVEFEIEEYRFTALNGGPHFTPNPTISFFLNFDPSIEKQAEVHLNRIWDKLSSKGTVLMELGEYPFSPKYGWVQDKFGISWQLILSDPDGKDRPFIIPSLMFCNENNNKAEEAINFYTAVFNNSRIGNIARYEEATGSIPEGALMFGDFIIEETWVAAMDTGTEHDFNFNEAISLVVNCETQAQIDHYWDKLSAVPEAEQCGWLKDKFGVSWQIVPAGMEKLFSSEDPEKAKRTMRAMLQMKKLDIEALENA